MHKTWRSGMTVALVLLSTAAFGQLRDFPVKPLRIIVPTTPGGIVDLVTRLLARETHAPPVPVTLVPPHTNKACPVT